MPFLEHLAELRRRLLRCVLYLTAGFILCWTQIDWLLAFVLAPVRLVLDQYKYGSLVALDLAELLLIQLKLALLGGLLLSFPLIMWELWLFVRPALSRPPRGLTVGVVLGSVLLTAGGLLFSYEIALPFGVNFLVNYVRSSVDLQLLLTLNSAFSLSMAVLAVFPIVFQLPLVMVFLTWVGVVRPKFWSAKLRYAIVIAFIVGAILTPPDVLSQILLSVPLLLLYGVGMVLARMLGSRRGGA